MDIGILEDNPAIVEWLTIALEIHGYKVHAYTYGAALLEALLSKSVCPLPFDVLIVDLLLPGEMSGSETVTHIQRFIPPEKLPVIFMSGAGISEIERVKASLPHIPVLRKPFKMNTLLQLIETLTVSQYMKSCTERVIP